MTLVEDTILPGRARMASALSVPGLIGAYFGLRVSLTFLFFRFDPAVGAEVGVGLNLLLLVFVAFYAVGSGPLFFRPHGAVWPFRFVLAFLGLALVSLSWSETASRLVAFGYWSAMAADVALVMLLLGVKPAARASESLLKGFVCGVALLALIAWVSPTLSDLRLGDDEFLNPNAIGFECALGALLCQHLAPQGARWKWLGLALAVTLLRSLSKTSILAFVIVETVYLTWNRTIPRRTKVALATCSLLIVAAFWNLLSSYYAYYTNNGTQAETLTGRVGIWIVTLGLALEEPWFGHGFHSFRAVIPPFGDFEPWHAHNELLHQFFVYGVAGVGIVVALYASLFVLARRHRSHDLSQLTRSFLLLVVIRGFTDTERFDLSLPLWAITALSLTLAARQTEETA